jgi:CRP/FNR family cyclic AMP-dependent transcriptional regulator
MRINDRINDIDLASMPLFQDMTPVQVETVRSVMSCTVSPPNTVLIRENLPGENVFFVLHGMVRICVQRDGQDVIFGMRGAGDILGEISALDGSPRVATAISHTQCTCLMVSTEDFNEVLLKMYPFVLNLTRFMAKRIRRMTGQLDAMATLSVPGRLARQITFLASEYGVPAESEISATAMEIPFRLTQASLSHMIGATRVQVNQIFSQWREKELIELRKNRVVILNDAALQALII